MITAGDFYSQHNEHRIVLTRLWVLVDFEAFRGQGYFLLVVILGSHVALGVLLGMIASEGSRSAATRATVVLASVAFLVAPVQLETLTWSFVTQYIHVYLFAAASFWAIGKLATRLSVPHEIAWTALAAGSVAAGTLSNANGVIAAILAGALTLLLPLRVLPRLTIFSVSAVAAAAYLWGYEAPPSLQHLKAPLDSLQAIAAWSKYVFTYLGSIIEATGSPICWKAPLPPYLPGPIVARPECIGSAMKVGLLGGVTWAVCTTLALWRWLRGDHDMSSIVLLSLSAFVVATSMVTAYGRLGYGGAHALSARYMSSTVVFWVCLLGAAWRLINPLQEARQPLGIAVALVAGLLLATSYLSWFTIGAQVRERTAHIDVLTKDLRDGKFIPEHVIDTFPDPNRIRPAIDFLRSRKMSIFAQD